MTNMSTWEYDHRVWPKTSNNCSSLPLVQKSSLSCLRGPCLALNLYPTHKGHLGLHSHFGSLISWHIRHFCNDYISLRIDQILKQPPSKFQLPHFPWTYCFPSSYVVSGLVSMSDNLHQHLRIWGDPLMGCKVSQIYGLTTYTSCHIYGWLYIPLRDTSIRSLTIYIEHH